MKIDLLDLNKYLSPLSPFYLISGDELLLVEESIEKIQAAAKAQEFNEWITWQVSSQFDWQQFHALSENLSLFASKRFIILRFLQAPNDAAKKALEQYCQQLPTEQTVLMVMPKLEAQQAKANWYQTILKQGIHLPIWPIPSQQLPNWLKHRLTQAGFSIDSDALALFAEQVDGNLFAAKQEIDKLKLLHPAAGKLTKELLMEALSDHARFDIFNLVDTCLSGDTKQAIKILSQLHQEGVDAILVLWALKREIFMVFNLLENLSAQSIDQLLQTQGIWEKRKPLYRICLKRTNLANMQKLIHYLVEIDRAIKGISFQNPWVLLESSCILMCGK